MTIFLVTQPCHSKTKYLDQINFSDAGEAAQRGDSDPREDEGAAEGERGAAGQDAAEDEHPADREYKAEKGSVVLYTKYGNPDYMALNFTDKLIGMSTQF